VQGLRPDSVDADFGDEELSAEPEESCPSRHTMFIRGLSVNLSPAADSLVPEDKETH